MITNPNNSGGMRETAPLLLNVLEAANRLGISKWTIYELMHQGRLPSVKIQSRRFIATSDLEAYVETLRADAGTRHGL